MSGVNMLALALAIVGYVLLMLTNPVRASLRDGWRCVRRYPVLWRRLAWLGCANALFLLAVNLSFQMRGVAALTWGRTAWHDHALWLSGSPDSLWWLPPSAIRAGLAESWLPALESIAGLFNNAVTTFPVALTAVVALFFNRHRYCTLLRSALVRRFGAMGWLMLAGVFIGALAVLAKAVLYFHPPGISDSMTVHLAALVMCPSSLFEYLFGLGVQVFLILHAYAWVRGITFEPDALREFALRRLGASVKWAVIVVLAGTLLVELPQVLALGWGVALPPKLLTITRASLAVVLVIFSTMQASLALHGETLRRAWRAHWQLVRRHTWELAWFLILAAVHLYALAVLRTLVLSGVGENTALGVVWTLAWPLPAGLIAGWMLASWVCLFKRCES